MPGYAIYNGVCPECGGNVKGRAVHRNEFGDWVHDTCPETDLDRDQKKPVCQTCWLIHPEGACLE